MSACAPDRILQVGIAEDQSGPLAEISQQLDKGRRIALQLLHQEKKEKPPIRLKLIDTMNSPEKTANAFRSLISQHHVKLLLGVPSSECSQVAKHVAESRSVPFISNAYDAELLNQTEKVSLLRQNPGQLGKLIALYFFYVMKKNRLAVIYDEALLSAMQSSGGYLEEGRLVGATMIEEIFSSFDRPADWQISWSKLFSARPEVVLICADPSTYRDMLIIAKRVLNIQAIFVIQHLPLEHDLEEEPELFDQVYVMLPFYSEEQRFKDSNFYHVYHERFNEKPGFFAAQGHDEMVFLCEIMQARSQVPLTERFLNLRSYIADKEEYLTGFRGFLADGTSFHDMNVLKFDKHELEYIGKFWMEILSGGSLK
jgi:ABC-type branched-subunit amino acid transport system substrate-binding protein